MTERQTQTREQRAAAEALRRSNPLQILCAECFKPCFLGYELTGRHTAIERWMCYNKAHN